MPQNARIAGADRRCTLVLATFLTAAAPADAHNLPDCAHDHLPNLNQYHVCDPNNVACAVTANAVCTTEKSTIVQAARWCRCVEADSSCFAAYNHSFITSGVPGPFDTLLYSTASAEDNEVSVFAGRGLLGSFDAETTALEGTILLTYGSFSDPQNVEVLVDEVDLTFPSLTLAGVDSGVHQVTLTQGADQYLSYDSTTGLLAPTEGAVLVDISNDVSELTGVPVYFEASIDLDPSGDGPATVYGQLSTELPADLTGLIFLGDFETGDTVLWGLWPAPVVGLLASACAAVGLRRRRRARKKAVDRLGPR